MELFRRSIEKEKGESEGGRKAARSTLGVFVVLGILVFSAAVVAQSPFITPDINNHSLNESTADASTEVEVKESSLPEDVNASVDADGNTTASNTTVTIEQSGEIEEPQQVILNRQGYNYTVAENGISAGSQFVKPTEDIGIRARLGDSPEGITPFFIYGWVKYTNGTAVLDPNVTILNLNTSETWSSMLNTVETNATLNYYQLLTSSCNVSAGDVLNFSADDGVDLSNPHEVTVTLQNMTDGGLFAQNLTIPTQQAGMCGDVDGSEMVDMADYFLLVDYIAEIPGRTLESEWAGDVDCSGKVDMADYFLLVDYIAEIPGRDLNCC